MIDDDFDSRLESFPEAWKPKAGAKVIGKVVLVEEREGEYGTYPVLVVRADDGAEIAIHCFHTVLRNELAKLRPAAGDRIGIKYFGKDAAKGYERYRCIVDRPQVGPDWDAIRAKAEAELQGDDELAI